MLHKCQWSSDQSLVGDKERSISNEESKKGKGIYQIIDEHRGSQSGLKLTQEISIPYWQGN